jgi:hypothetical protein
LDENAWENIEKQEICKIIVENARILGILHVGQNAKKSDKFLAAHPPPPIFSLLYTYMFIDIPFCR